MKILVQGYLGKYSSMGQWVVDGLKRLGHEVTGVDRFDASYSPNDYDLHFIVDSSEDMSGYIKDSNIPRVCWLMDTHMPGGLQRALGIAAKCDYVFSTNKEYGQDVLKANRVDSVLMPITYNNLYKKKLNYKTIDVVMIGHPNSSERLKLWKLLSKYNNFCGVANTLEEYVQYMSCAKIVINQPTEPWDIILNNRFFEAMAYKSLLLQKRLRTSLIEDLGFSNGRDFLYWSNLDTLQSKIEYVLENYDDYSNIIKSGSKRVRKYSLTKQLSKILKVINAN